MNLIRAAAFFLDAFAATVTTAQADPGKAQITGTVVDEAGQPATQAEVRNVDGRTPPVLTDAAGRFSLTLNDASIRYEKLIATADDGALMGLWETEDTDGSTVRSTIDVQLTLKPSGKVLVKVVDAAGKAVSGARIASAQAHTLLTFAVSDAQGGAELRVPQDAKITHVLAMKPGAGYEYLENAASAKWLDVKPLPAEVTLTLDGASRFEVRAVDSKGKPIPGVEFSPWYFRKTGKKGDLNVGSKSPGFPLSRTTDAEGLATFDFLPAQMEKKVPMLCLSDDWHQQKDPVWSPRDGDSKLETTLLRCGTASGLVLHADGKPAAGVMLQAEGRGKTNHYFRKTVRSGADGSFQFTLYPEQSYLIAVTDEQWAAPSTSGFLMREGEVRADLFFTLGKGTLIHGTVFHVTTGKPLAKKTVTVIEQGAAIDQNAIQGPFSGDSAREQLVRWTSTDDEGRYSIRLGPGAYEVSADYADEGRAQIFIEDKAELQRDFHITPRQ